MPRVHLRDPTRCAQPFEATCKAPTSCLRHHSVDPTSAPITELQTSSDVQQPRQDSVAQGTREKTDQLCLIPLGPSSCVPTSELQAGCTWSDSLCRTGLPNMVLNTNDHGDWNVNVLTMGRLEKTPAFHRRLRYLRFSRALLRSSGVRLWIQLEICDVRTGIGSDSACRCGRPWKERPPPPGSCLAPPGSRWFLNFVPKLGDHPLPRKRRASMQPNHQGGGATKNDTPVCVFMTHSVTLDIHQIPGAPNLKGNPFPNLDDEWVPKRHAMKVLGPWLHIENPKQKCVSSAFALGAVYFAKQLRIHKSCRWYFAKKSSLFELQRRKYTARTAFVLKTCHALAGPAARRELLYLKVGSWQILLSSLRCSNLSCKKVLLQLS